ncbi:class II histone deacetylase [Brevibacillus fluminis]|uniref:Class II histone deacetylase n=1 Tax=Brevibacillus fluminis TaxID=511487 RepID=A0A3M8CWG8_9BACL|nr:class II histone deacetylase [Brevibacillus fluminis]RNB79577.1 class II histone deacetylase [Brevibacillus fluminis]
MGQKTAFIYDERYFWHDTGSSVLFLPPGEFLQPDGTAESPDSKRRVKNLLERSKFIRKLTVMEPRSATLEEVESFHTPAYVERIKRLSDSGGGDAGGFTPFGPGSYEIALLSAGGAITAVDAVMQGQVDNAYALTRPPGHHAQADSGAGYCIFNNVVIAAHHARRTYGLKRIMVLDWDVHHGNGTEDAFYADPDTLFVSLHQENNFPNDRGYMEHTGEGEGMGTTLNIPLYAGTSDAGYLYAFEKLIVPIAEQFQPELILISAGQDANNYDPLARMMVTADGFHRMASIVKQLADRVCQGRVVACHEGGYSTAYVPFCTLRVIEALRGEDSGVPDPFLVSLANMPRINQLLPHQKEQIDQIARIHTAYWKIG